MNNIPELTPNANIAGEDSNESIRVEATNLNDIKVDQPCMCCTPESMAPNSVETIGDIKL
jgi:hypothetical protein